MKTTRFLLVLALLVVACEDDKKERLIAQTTGEAAAPLVTAPPAPSPSVAPSAAPSASASADMKRFDPKHKCPTGQTHFYLEGDFCRKRCFSNADCGKKERCSVIDYPFVVDGGTAGMAKFCEGT